jgi:luciferase family oxidoreductase group 1
VRLSIVELATVRPGTTEADGLADAVLTARHADALGYHRVWFAEHHLSRSNASHHPELLIAMAGAKTAGIRVGSGSVLLNHYSPFKVAEMFQQLEAMLPGRVDLGLGRATSGAVVDAALRPDRRSVPVDDHAERVTEVLAWLYEAFPDDHPFAGHPLMPSVPGVPQTWLLGSSPGGSSLAAGLGIGYSFAAFINPAAAGQALRAYRERFRPSGFGLERPRAMLAVNVSVGEDTADARRLVASAKGFYARLGRLGAGATLPSAEQALRELTLGERDEPTAIVDGRWPRFVAGAPDEVRRTLERMLDESRADELMIPNLIADAADRRASHERLAGMFALTARHAWPPGAAARAA